MSNIQMVNPRDLHPHPERGDYKTIPDINSGTYLRIRESIEERGIEHPIKVQSGTNIIIAGHTRTEIATELGLEQVPVVYLDLDDDAAKHMLVEDNFERSLDEEDLIKLARVLKKYQEKFGFEHGGNRTSGTGYHLKTVSEIAEMFDMGERQFRKYLKLLDLIEPLQDIVSRKLMGVKAGSLIAALDSARQEAFYSIVRPSLSTPGYTVSEALAKNYRDNCLPAHEAEKDGESSTDWTNELNFDLTEETQADVTEALTLTEAQTSSVQLNRVRATEDAFGEIDTRYQVESHLQPNPLDRKRKDEIVRTGQTFTDPGERTSFFKRSAKTKLEQLERALLREESELASALAPTIVGGSDEDIDGSLKRIALILERFHAKVDSIAAQKA